MSHPPMQLLKASKAEPVENEEEDAGNPPPVTERTLDDVGMYLGKGALAGIIIAGIIVLSLPIIAYAWKQEKAKRLKQSLALIDP